MPACLLALLCVPVAWRAYLDSREAVCLEEERLMSVGQDEFEATTDGNEELVLEMENKSAVASESSALLFNK